MKRSWLSVATSLLTWSYLLLILVVLGLLRLAGDRWWPATLLTFGPRWVTVVPLPFLAILALCFRRRALLLVALTAFLAVGPIMGYCVPWRTLTGGAPSDDSHALRIVSVNIGGGVEMDRLADFVRATDPDIVTFVEWGAHRNIRAVLGDGWYHHRGAGILIASRHPIVDIKRLISPRLERWNNPAFRADIEAPWGIVHVVGVHLETPREGLQEVLGSKWKGAPEMERITAIRRTESELASQLAAEVQGPALVAGDFNMPTDSTIYRQYWSGWQNALSTAGLGFCHTKFTKHFGIRIDHILASHEWNIRSAEVGPDLGGDHRPVVVTVYLR